MQTYSYSVYDIEGVARLLGRKQHIADTDIIADLGAGRPYGNIDPENVAPAINTENTPAQAVRILKTKGAQQLEIACAWIAANLPRDREPVSDYCERYNNSNHGSRLDASTFGRATTCSLIRCDGVKYKQVKFAGERVWIRDGLEDIPKPANPPQQPANHPQPPQPPQPQQRQTHAGGYVYFIKSPPPTNTQPQQQPQPTTIPIKIGRSQAPPARRMKELQTGSWTEHHLILAVECGDSVRAERELHMLYAANLIRGEWFRFTTAELADAMRAAIELALA